MGPPCCPWRRGQQLHAGLAWPQASSTRHGERRRASQTLRQGHRFSAAAPHTVGGAGARSRSPRPTLSLLPLSEAPKVTWKQPSPLSPASPRPAPTDSLREAPCEKTPDSEPGASTAARQRCQRGDRSPLQQAHGRHGYCGQGRKWGEQREPGGTIHQ